MVERFVSSTPDVLYTYLRMRVDVVTNVLLRRISLPSYLNSLRYLIDIPSYSASPSCLLMPRQHVLVGRFLLLHLQNLRQTRRRSHLLQRQGAPPLHHPARHRLPVSPFPHFLTCSHSEPLSLRSSLQLLRSLTQEAPLRRLFSILAANLQRTRAHFLALLHAPTFDRPVPRFHSSSAVSFTQNLANSSAEIASNCFLLLARFFYRDVLTGIHVSTIDMQLPRGEAGTTRPSTLSPFPRRNSRSWAHCGIKPR